MQSVKNYQKLLLSPPNLIHTHPHNLKCFPPALRRVAVQLSKPLKLINLPRQIRSVHQLLPFVCIIKFQLNEANRTVNQNRFLGVRIIIYGGSWKVSGKMSPNVIQVSSLAQTRVIFYYTLKDYDDSNLEFQLWFCFDERFISCKLGLSFSSLSCIRGFDILE